MLQTFSTIRKVAVTLDASTGTGTIPLFTHTPFSLSGYRLVSESLALSNIQAIAYIYSLPQLAFPVFDLTESDSQQLLTAINLEWQNSRIQLDTLVRIGSGGTYQRIASNSLTNPHPYPYKSFTIENQVLGSDDMLAVQIRNAGYGTLQNGSGGSDIVTVSADLTTTITVVEVPAIPNIISNTITTTESQIVAGNSNRKNLTFYNSTTNTVFIDIANTVSISSYTVALLPGDYYEAPVPIYTGAYYAVTTSGTASINIRSTHSMGYFGNSPTSTINNAIRSVSDTGSKAINAADENLQRATEAIKTTTNRALTPIQISLDFCNLIINVNDEYLIIRNPLCNVNEPPPIPGHPVHGNPTPRQPAKCASGVQVLCKAFIERLIIQGDRQYLSTFNVTPRNAVYPTPSNTFFPNLPDIHADFYIDITGKFAENFNTEYASSIGLNGTTQRNFYISKGGQISGDAWSFEQELEYRIFFNTSTRQIYQQVLSNSKPHGGIPDAGVQLTRATAESYNALNSTVNVFEYATLPNIDRETNVFQLLFICSSEKFIDPPDEKKHKPKKCKCMCSDDLLKLVLKRIGELPATVPTNIADTTDKSKQTLNSIAEMIFWHVKQMDAISGQYPIPLTVKRDPSVSDSKDVQLELPNIAETLAEILGLLIATKRDSHAGLVAGISTLTEAGMIKNLATQTFDIALANAEYLGYKLEQQKRTIPCTFTPNAKSVTETLRPSNVDIVSYHNNDNVDLQDEILKLTTMADRWNAQNWRSIGKTAISAAAALKKNFIDAPQSVSEIHQAVKEESFGQFLNEVQAGFTTTPGITDIADPWGDSPQDAPLVREVGVIDLSHPQVTVQTPADAKKSNTAKTVANIANILSKL